MRIRSLAIALTAGFCALVLVPERASGQAIVPVPGTTTRDIAFTSHDGYPMLGRLTMPDAPGRHPVLVLIQTAQAQAKDGQVRDARGERVPAYTLYRASLAPLRIGFFSYEGRGVSSSATGGIVLDRGVYNTSTLANKVQDAISAIRTLQEQPDVDASRVVLRGISEGTLLAAEVAVEIPDEIAGLVLSGVIGSNMKAALVFMVTDGAFLQQRQFWDANGDERISLQEFEADPRGIRKQLPVGVVFQTFDRNGDGSYTVEDSRIINAPIAAAIRGEDFDVFVPVLEGRAVAQVPGTTVAWMQDHFRQPAMWDLLAKISVPVGLFQGEDDGNTSVAEIRLLEERAKGAGRSNLKFHYFAGLGHGLGTIEYFNTGTPSAGYAAIFEFMKQYAQ